MSEFCKYCYGWGGKFYCTGQKATPECYYNGKPDVDKCKIYKPFSFFDFNNSSEEPNHNHVVKSNLNNEHSNPYWKRIEAISKAQRTKDTGRV